MSWIGNIEGKPDPNYVDPNPKVPDPSIPGRMVSTKKANRPFLVHKEYREKQNKLREEWLQRKKEREEKIARGEEVGPEEPDPLHEPEVGVLGLLKFLAYLLLFTVLAGKFITGDWLWGYDGKWVQLKTYIPQGEGRLFTEGLLAKYDGSHPDLPLYLAIDGDVYDVSNNRRVYGPGGAYHNMAGADAARAFATGCFAEHRTHDLRGLTEKELKSVENWKDFFKNHKDYPHVGRVSHPSIDPESPIPKSCKPTKEKKKKKQNPASAAKDGDDARSDSSQSSSSDTNGGAKHSEL